MPVNPLGPSALVPTPTSETNALPATSPAPGANTPTAAPAPLDTFTAAKTNTPAANTAVGNTAATPPAADYATRTVKKGDTLWAFASALKKAGDPRKHMDLIKEIQTLNPQIKDVNKIYPGQVFKLPNLPQGDVVATPGNTPPKPPAPNLPQGPVVTDDLGPVGTPAGGTARVPNDVEDLKDRNGVPWVSQLKPTGAVENFENGQFYCGPASVASEARRRGYGAELTDAQLLTKLAEVGKTKPVTGTSMNGIVAMAKEIGVPVDKTEVKYPGFDAAWTDAQLELGKSVVANGALETPEGPSGHFILVVGKDEKGDYKINDPWDSEKKRMTLDELSTFMARNPVHKGASVALG